MPGERRPTQQPRDSRLRRRSVSAHCEPTCHQAFCLCVGVRIQSAYAVDVVGDGRQADSVLALEIYGLAILDIDLPCMSGLEVLKRLRARKSR
jgi:CheY-like chemotaxis protein